MRHPLSAPFARQPWWRVGSIYQIYLRSFQDSNADGVGDLPGVLLRLPYVAQLGVDAIWLTPFFRSPMKDCGYDVSDYREVDPLFGNLDDFRRVLARAHELGLKVMIDQVLSHTSDRHPWFRESCSDASGSRADWYVWADPREDGSPPNNWLSVFGGSAWEWNSRRQKYYLHNFLASQPDLNFHNPQVQQAVLDDVRFWLEQGVDGLRLDTANFYFHDPLLRPNPARAWPVESDPAVTAVNPYAWQRHVYDKSRPENLQFLRRMRALLDSYPDTAMVGEIGDDDGLGRMAEYTQGGDKLHMAYSFDLLGPRHDAPFLHAMLERLLRILGDGWACWSLSNHDVPRLASRWGGAHPDQALLRQAALLQMTLLGTPCLYQGDELGLEEAELSEAELRDPYGIAMWPIFKGRDGCRTPMPWDAAQACAGFSEGTPWLPLCDRHRAHAVAQQQPGGLLDFYRELLAWRRRQPALQAGTMQLLPAHDQLLAYIRESREPAQRLLCAFNCSAQAMRWKLPAGFEAMAQAPCRGADLIDGTVHLEPWGVLLAHARGEHEHAVHEGAGKSSYLGR
jgi:alpha-glucosidase